MWVDGKKVVGDAPSFEQLQEAIVILLIDFLDRLSFPIGRQGYGCPVGIGTADHQNFVPLKAVVACDNVTGQMRAGDISDMDFSVGIGPGNRN